MADRNIYEGFLAWLRQSWGLLPDSEELIPMLMAAYTPAEASLLTEMPFEERTIEELAETKGLDRGELRSQLDEMAAKGMILRLTEGEKILYRLPDARFVFLRSFFWPARDNEITRKTAAHVNRYYRDGFGANWKDVHTKGLRAIPIRQTIEDPRQILPYEDTVRVLDKQNRFAVAHCACRTRKKLDENEPSCHHETENCLHFGKLADYIIQNGLGREITRDEAGEILAMAADAGLVHGISNWQEGVDTICNCCACCCLYMEAFHVLRHAKGMNLSNYEVRVNHETCHGCGLCVKRCPMKALRMEDSDQVQNKTGKITVLTPGICIGCGVCAHKCPSESLYLKRRDVLDHPPATIKEQRKRFLAEKEAVRGDSLIADDRQRGKGEKTIPYY